MRKLLPFTLLIATTCVAQQTAKRLPDAPPPPVPLELLAQATPPPAGSYPNGQNTPGAATSSPTGAKLTLAGAEKMALAHNPNISIAHLLQLAQTQVTREVRAGEMPDANANLTAVGAHDNSRITAGPSTIPSSTTARPTGSLSANSSPTSDAHAIS